MDFKTKIINSINFEHPKELYKLLSSLNHRMPDYIISNDVVYAVDFDMWDEEVEITKVDDIELVCATILNLDKCKFL